MIDPGQSAIVQITAIEARRNGRDLAEDLDRRQLLVTSARTSRIEREVLGELLRQLEDQKLYLAMGVSSPADAVARVISFVEMFQKVHTGGQ